MTERQARVTSAAEALSRELGEGAAVVICVAQAVPGGIASSCGTSRGVDVTGALMVLDMARDTMVETGHGVRVDEA